MRLPHLVKAYRDANRVSLRRLAKQTGVSISTLSRFERGALIDYPNFVRILRWLL